MRRFDCGNILTTLLLLPLFIGCQESSRELQKDSLSLSEIATEKYPLGFLYQADTLTLLAHFSECGEFGGHKEKMDIFCNYKREYFAQYTVDSIDLDCPEDVEENAIVVKDTLFRLTLENEHEIIQYLNKLFKRGLISKYPSHSNDYFNAHTRYSGLNLTTYEPDSDWYEFNNLINKLLKLPAPSSSATAGIPAHGTCPSSSFSTAPASIPARGTCLPSSVLFSGGTLLLLTVY